MLIGGLLIGIGILLLIYTAAAQIQLAIVTYTASVPEGQFYINGEPATTTSKHTVANPTLNFKFVASKNGDQIVAVRVTLYTPGGPSGPAGNPVNWKGTQSEILQLTETTTDTEWDGAGTLPAEGSYQINGFAVTAANQYQMMSLLGSWAGSSGVFHGTPVSEINIYLLSLGFAIIAVGSVVVYKAKKEA